MKQATYKLFRCLRKAIAWLILFILLLHAATSLFLSHLNYFRPTAEKTLGRLLNTQVHLGYLHGSLPFINPQIEIGNLAIKNRQLVTTQKFQTVTLSIDLIRSLLNRKITVKQVSIDHASLKLIKSAQGWHLEGIEEHHSQKDNTHYLLSLLLAIKYIKLEHIDVNLSDLHREKNSTIALQKLIGWKETHKLFLQSHLLLNKSPVSVDAIIDTPTSEITAEGASAYLSSDVIELLPWFQLFLPEKYSRVFTRDVPVKAQLWLHWKPDSWKVFSQFNAPDTQFSVHKKPVSLQKLTGSFWLTGSTLKDWSAQLTTSDFLFNQIKYPASKVSLQHMSSNNQPAFTMQVSEINIDQLKTIALNSHLLPPFYQKLLAELNPDGSLVDTTVIYYPNRQPLDFIVTTSFKNLSVDAWHGAPSATNISGSLKMGPHRGSINVDSKDLSLGLTEIFEHPWHFQTFKGQFLWKLTKDSYTLYTSDTTATILPSNISTVPPEKSPTPSTVHTLLKLDIPLKKNKPVNMALEVNMDHLLAKDAQQYIPFKLLPEALSSWLEKSVPEGDLSNSTFLWHGPLDDIQPGNFSWGVNLNINNGRFHYSPNWPDVQHTSASLHINQNGLTVSNATGTIYDSKIDTINVHINSFEYPVLNLSAKSNITGQSAEKLFKQTPINQLLKGAPQNWQIAGDFNTALTLDLPLDSQNARPDITVHTDTHNGGFAIQERHIALQKIKGTINFSTEQGLKAKDIQAMFLGHPALISIENGTLGGKENITNITLKSHADFSDLNVFTPKFLQPFAKGSIDYKAHIGIPESGHYFISVNSYLKGLSIDLPGQFKKAKETKSDFDLLITPDSNDKIIVYSHYADKINAVFNINKEQLVSGKILLNPSENKPLVAPKDEFVLSGHLSNINIDQWQQWYQKHKQMLTYEHSSSEYPKFIVSHLKINHASFKNQAFNDIVLNGQVNNDNFKMSVNSDKVKGSVSKTVNRPYDIELDSITLPAKQKTSVADLSHDYDKKTTSDILSEVDPSLFPALHFSAKTVLFGNTPYGNISFNLYKINHGLILKNITASLGGLDINGTLSWVKQHKNITSSFVGTLETADMQQVFKNWHYSNPNFIAKEGKITMDTSWAGSPAGFNFKKAKGNATIKLSSGQIKSGKTGGLHLLGLLNIDAIARRLRFDFSDLFDSGISFDTITGHISFNNGLIDIDKPLVIDGPSSDFTLEGIINLPEKFIDMGMIVTLPVTQNLPIIGLLLGQPVIAGAIYLFDKLIGETFMKFTSVRYDIFGPINSPKITLDKLFANKLKKRYDETYPDENTAGNKK